MKNSIVKSRKKTIFDLKFIKNYMRVSGDDHDASLTYLMEVATDWVEEELGKTLITQTRNVIHRNNSFRLPYGPILKVLKVVYHKQELKEGDYTLEPLGDSVLLTVPFRWKCPEVDVTYEAGFGESAEEVPSVLRHAVLGTLEYLFEHKGDITSLENQSAPWLKAHRSFHVL
jgi:uncharacterized phiE125 gp8 family phage protein